MKRLDMLPGNQLSATDQAEVLRSYVHRFTGEHRPEWTKRTDCNTCPVQFASDAEWLAHTLFHVTKDGRLDKRHNACQSSPTWPYNPELRT